MTTRAMVDDFLAQRAVAIVGVSRSGKKFGNYAMRDLRARGYRVFPVHPEASRIDDVPCYASLAALPEPVGGVLVVVPPTQTDKVVREAAAAGITRVWMQQGAESADAMKFCESHGLSVISGYCVLMFAQPSAWYHRAHRWVCGVMGRLPQ